jgi:hypothetical protein
MAEFKFTEKTDVNEYFEEIINVDVLKSEFDFQFYNTNKKLVYYKDEGVSLRFLNRLHEDFTYFLNNKHDYYLVKNYFLLYDTNVRFIDSFVYYYNIDLSPMGEVSLDFIILHSNKLKQKIFSYKYPEDRMKKISEQFQELLLMQNTKSKLSQLISLRSRVRAMCFVGNFINTQSELVHKFESEIDNLKDLLSLGLLPDDITKSNENEKLALDLENALKEIESLKKLFKESNSQALENKDETLSNKSKKSKSFDVIPKVHTVKNEDSSEPEYEHYVFANDNKLYQLIDTDELYEREMATLQNQTSNIEEKRSESDKKFPDYILHKHRDQLADMIKNEFSTEKAKPLRIVLKAMELYNPPLITIGKRQGKEIYNSLSVFLDREIGTYQGVFGSTITSKADQSDIESVTLRLNHILKMIDNG